MRLTLISNGENAVITVNEEIVQMQFLIFMPFGSGSLPISVFCVETGGYNGNPVWDYFYNWVYDYNTKLLRGGSTMLVTVAELITVAFRHGIVKLNIIIKDRKEYYGNNTRIF